MTTKPLLRLDRSRLPWRNSVTVCIAARCLTPKGRQCIVTVSDTKLTIGGAYSGDMATLKLRLVSDKWYALVAGTFAHHVPLLGRIVEAIDNEEPEPSEAKIGKICTDAFIAENRRLAEESVLSQFGLTLEQFLKSRNDLGDSIYERTWGDISRVKVGCQLLICGFDYHGHLLVVSNPEGENISFVTNCDFPGFACIGSGAYIAESTLFSFHQNPASSLHATICAAAFAKFAAESASDVGEETYLRVLTRDQDDVEVDRPFALVKELKAQWKRHGKPRLPPVSLKAIEARVTEKEKSPG
jgi:hypothetical protein